MRTVEEIKEDLEVVLRDGSDSDADEAALRLVFDGVEFLIDIRDSLRSSRLRDIV